MNAMVPFLWIAGAIHVPSAVACYWGLLLWRVRSVFKT